MPNFYKILKTIDNIISKPIYKFTIQLSSIVISAGAGLFLKESFFDFSSTEKTMQFFYSLSLLSMLIALSYIKEFIPKQTTTKIFLSTDKSNKSAYEYCSDKANEATKSIFVFGPCFNDTIGTTSHDDYLAIGILKAIYKHINNSYNNAEQFNYTRFVQLEQSVYAVSPKNGIVKSASINNKALSDHIDEILKINKQHTEIKAEIKAIGHVTSFPSTLIIDDRFIFFSLASNLQNNDASNKKLQYDVVLGIEDENGKVAKEFRSIIEKFSLNSFQITEIKKP